MGMTAQGMRPIVATDDLTLSADTEESSLSTSYFKKKEIKLFDIGQFRVYFELKSPSGVPVYGQIYKNGVALGTERSTSSPTYVVFTEDFNFSKNDLVQLYVKTSNASYYVNCDLFRIKSDAIIGVIILD